MISDTSSQDCRFNHWKCPINATFIEPSIDITGGEMNANPDTAGVSTIKKTQTFLIAGI